MKIVTTLSAGKRPASLPRTVVIVVAAALFLLPTQLSGQCDPPEQPNQPFPTVSQPDFWIDPGSGNVQMRRALQSAGSTCHPTWDGASDPRNGVCSCDTPPCSSSTPSIVAIRVSGTRVLVDYDAPNWYCTNTGDWPPDYTCSNGNPVGASLQLLNGSNPLVPSAWVFYESGTWDTGYDLTCGGASLQLTAKITTVCDFTSQTSGSLTVPASGCQLPVSCPIDGGAGGAGSGHGPVGPGGVSIGPNGSDPRPEAPIAGPLAPTFFYNDNNTQFSNSGLSAGWFFDYGETLVPAPGGILVWTDRFGFKRKYAGNDTSGYSASDPGDARGSIAVVSGNYVLSTPDGASRTFAKGGSPGYGYWTQTVDRWGNGAKGNATNASSTPSTSVQELFGGVTTGRSITLGYNGKHQLTSVADVKGGITSLGYDANGRLSTICAADQTCPSANPWRTFAYDGSSSRLTSVTDAAGQVIRGFDYSTAFGVLDTWIGAASFASSSAKEKTAYAYSSPTVTVSRYKDDGTHADTSYTVAAKAGMWRTTAITGACPECGDENSSYVYDATTGYPTSRTDGDGNVTTKQFNGDGSLLTLVEASGSSLSRTTSYVYAVPGTDALPTVWSTTVKDFWKTKTQPSGVNTGTSRFVTTTRTWSGTGNLILTETVTGYTSNLDSSLTSQTTVTTYDATGRILQIDGPRTDVADITTFSYYTNTETTVANRNRLKQQIDPVAVTTTFDSYDPLAGVTQQTAKAGLGPSDVDVVTQFSYDARGRLLTRTLKATPSTTEQDLITTTAYDSRGRLTSTAVNAGVSPATTKTLYGYEDGTDRLLTRTESTQSNGSGDRVTYVYDNQGNINSETYGYFNGTTTTTDYQVSRAYSASCHVLSQTYPADSAMTNYSYDCVGNLTGVQDSMHGTANLIYGYDNLNRLHQVTRTATPNDVTTNFYDALDHLIQVQDPNNNSTNYVYDDFGALREQITTLAGNGQLDITTNDYDGANNLKFTGNGQRASGRVYDASNRLLAVKSTSGPLTYAIYTYDTGCLQDPTTKSTFGKGRLCRLMDSSGTTIYGYDRRGLVTIEQKSLSGANHTYLPFVYAYDAAGRRTAITYPTGDTLAITYSDSSRPMSMSFTPSGGVASALLSSITHKAFGPITGFSTLTSTVAEARTFDTRFRRLSQTTVFGSTTLMGLSYASYDKEGNLLTLTDTVNSTFNRTFGYEPDRYFLTASAGPYGTGYASLNLAWTYDGTGNRLTEMRGGATTTYGYGNDGAGHSNGVLTSLSPGGSVTSLSTGDLSVDENGATDIYDAFGRLLRVFDPSCRNMRFNLFSHDGNGHRVTRTSQECTQPTSLKREDFLYASDGKLLFYEPFNSSDAVTGREEYVYLEDEPVAIIRSSFTADNGTFFLHGDQLGRPLAMTSTAGTMVWRAEYEPFGKSLAPRTNSLSFAPRFRFPGQWENGDSGDLPGGPTTLLGSINALTDNWYRTYTQRWGRYSQADPLGQSGGRDLYAYALDRPLQLRDPLGLEAQPAACCDCPDGIWSYFGHSGGIGLIYGKTKFYGTYTCRSKPMVSVDVEGECKQTGLFFSANVFSVDSSLSPLGLPGAKACRIDDLLKKLDPLNLDVFAGIRIGVGATGNLNNGTGVVSGGISVGAGFGVQGCSVRRRQYYPGW